ncbi:protein kinase [Marinobacter koreensis]|uniref:Protein kinase n=1 Tax=Marinobacter koreensis TaxID=335974 RepID=A0ABW0RR56_9GAMM|nr:serine/threonine protein kinase [Marinobacter koreensis]
MNPSSSLISSIFSLRSLVVAIAAVFAVAGDQIPMVSWLDRLLLNVLGSSEGAEWGAIALDQWQSVLAERGLAQPAWGHLSVQGGLVFAAAYLVFAVPAMGAAVALPVTLLLGGGLVVLQAAMMFYHSLWLPLGEINTLLAVGYVVMLFWLQPHRRIRALTDNVLDARLKLGQLLLNQGQTDEALATLRWCPESEETLELRYQIALQQERKRQYDKALQTYLEINDRKRKFRDVPDRLEALQKVAGEATVVHTGGFEATRTLVMPDQAVSRPTLGRYEIVRELGRGAMGVVYLGTDPKISRTVAIKTLSYHSFDGKELQELKGRFFREAEAAGRLNHPAIVTVYDVGEEADLAYIAMDYAEGRPLSDFGRAGRLLPLGTVLEVMARVADALAYAHEQKIVHRDIKPGNIIYNPDTGGIKITDFGIAKITDDSVTRTGSVMGSPLYMSPEQLKGQKVTGASDIYSLGVTLFKLVTGETPYQGDTLANLTYQILNKRPRSARSINADLSNGVVRLINKSIQREPDKRFGSASEMAEALRRLAAREDREVAS